MGRCRDHAASGAGAERARARGGKSALAAGARRAADDGALALSADPAAGRPVRPYGPLSGRARPRALAVAAAILQLPLGGDRQSRGRSAGMPLAPLIGLEPAVKLIVTADPAADRRRLPVGRARGSRARSADRLFRPAVHLRLSVPVRLRQFRAVDGVGVPRLRAVAAARAAGTNARCRSWLFVPISLVVFFTPHLRLGALGLLCFSAEAVRLHDRGRRWLRAGHRGRAARVGDGPADPGHAGLAQRNARRIDLDWFNWQFKWRWLYAALRDRWKMVRHRLAGRRRRWCSSTRSSAAS